MFKNFLFLIFMFASCGALGVPEQPEEDVIARVSVHPLQPVVDPTSMVGQILEPLPPQGPGMPLKQLTPIQKIGCCLCLWSPCICLGGCFNCLTEQINWATCGCFYGIFPCLDSK